MSDKKKDIQFILNPEFKELVDRYIENGQDKDQAIDKAMRLFRDMKRKDMK